MQRSVSLLLVPLLLLSAGCTTQVRDHDVDEGEVVADESLTPAVPIYDNLGTYHHRISTSTPEVQQYFDQGLRLTYAFNHGEAVRAFSEAARLDPNCAMCYWGTAYAYGPHVNAPMDSASGVAAYEAVQRAMAVAHTASEREQAYIRALSARYAADAPSDRAHLDSAYASAIGEVARQYPDDPDAVALHAEARMDLRPWNYWTKMGEPYPGTAELVADLERILATNPNHPGACHFYIHAVEAVAPEKAVPCAERLAGLMPGAGHLVHMPAHIFIRVGRYADAIESNLHAVHTDETYIADQRPSGVYPVAYYPHNYHFLAFAATLAGRSNQAIEAARKVVEKVPVDVARQVPPVEPLVPYLHLTLLNFGRWDDVLREPLPPSDLRFATGMVHYTRGVAFAAKGNFGAAEVALDTIRRIHQATADGDNKTVLEIATHALAGEIDARGNRLGEAEAHFRQAMRLEDGLLYFEPPPWPYPIRHSLGAVLLRAGRAAQAETVYREDLVRFPENGWALHGLAASLRAQGKTAELDPVEQRLARAWAGADVQLASSRF